MLFSPHTLWTTLESLLQPGMLATVAMRGFLLLAVTTVIVRLAGRASAASRHLAWTMAMVALLLLPVLSTLLPPLSVQGPAWLAHRWSGTAPARGASVNMVGSTQPQHLDLSPPTTVPPRFDTSSGLRTEALAQNETLLARPNMSGGRPSLQAGTVKNDTDAVLSEVTGPVMSDTGDAASGTPPRVSDWLLPLWLMGVIGVAGWFALQYWSVRWLTMHAVEVEQGELVDLLHRLRRHVGLKRPVRLRIGHRTMMPMTWGIFRPVVLLPENVAAWPASRQEDVLLHELAHIKRRDHLSQVLAQLACALHWFNPLTWYAGRRMMLEREHACDDTVLNRGTRPSDYATNLLEVARSMKRGPVTSMAAIAMAGRSTLKDRLKAVLDEGRTRNPLGGRVTAVALLLVAAVALPLATLEVVTVEEALAVGPKAGEHQRGSRVLVDGDAPVIIHDGQVIELPLVDTDEILAVLETQIDGRKDRGDLDEQLERFRRFGEGLGIGFRELDGDSDLPLRYFAFDMAARAEMAEQLDALGESLSDMTVFVQPEGGVRVFDLDSGSAPRAPHAPRPPRVPRAARAPRISIGPIEIADGTWSFHSNGKNNWSWNDGDDRMSLRTEGEITFNEEGTDVVAMSRDGYFEFEMEDGSTDYRVRFRPDRDGEIQRTWWVDGDKRDYDDAARAWMAKAMPEMMRRTGFNAEQRVRHILDEGGVDAVLDEIDQLHSDHAMRLYFGELLRQAKLDGAQYKRVFEKAGDTVRSDFELASILESAAEAGDLGEEAIVEYAAAASRIDSDFEQRRALTALVRDQKLGDRGIEATLKAAEDIDSDFELASFLVELAEHNPQAYHSPLFLDALTTVGSDFEQRRVLDSVVKERDLSDENLARALKMGAEGIHSDFELAELLTAAARRHRIQGPVVQPWLDALDTIDSDFEFRRAAEEPLHRGELDKAAVVQLLRTAERNVNSDFEMSELLQTVADNYEVDGDLREAYMQASRSIRSQHESRRALSAIDASTR
jgi:beta-lactamase regulating signal transducer with metallopeptidase domain